jgi:hypothetical protein
VINIPADVKRRAIFAWAIATVLFALTCVRFYFPRSGTTPTAINVFVIAGLAFGPILVASWPVIAWWGQKRQRAFADDRQRRQAEYLASGKAIVLGLQDTN